MAHKEITRFDILHLAAGSELDPRTVKRAVDRGIESMKSERDKAKLREVAAKLGLKLK
jgi:hypothetical protein